ncbi:hypothetical protein HYH03_012249 [Edaphochlamys debaryana]|uniref:Uncharacterized protein n=1 Tax=Edaphochlamys debaryana TaxID=47281 RepID=A0A835XQG4_9CHLO|nr:hypothetical protein HYH03_012249 [Edaphochlamys debaryana]|eukprot:KAG2489227.1 hypothetical protein HYH03_012249 [Edaphochlamys debaryana]
MSAKRKQPDPAMSTRYFCVRAEGDGYALELQVPGKQECLRLSCPGGGPQWPKAEFQTLTVVMEMCRGLEEHFARAFGVQAPAALSLVFEQLRAFVSSAAPIRVTDVTPEELRSGAVTQQERLLQHVVSRIFLSFLDTFLHGTAGMLSRPAAAGAVEALVGPLGWRKTSDVRACFVQWSSSDGLGSLLRGMPLGFSFLRDPTHIAQRDQADARFPYLCSAGRPKIFGKRFTQLTQLSCIPKSCGRDRGCRLGFLVLSDMLQAVCSIIESADPGIKSYVKPLIGDLLLELDGKGPRVEGVPDAVRIAVATAMASCARGWREAGERMDAWREAVQQSAVLAGLRGADDAPVLLAVEEALNRMQVPAQQGPAAPPAGGLPQGWGRERAVACQAAAGTSAPVATEPLAYPARMRQPQPQSQPQPQYYYEDREAGASASVLLQPHRSPSPSPPYEPPTHIDDDGPALKRRCSASEPSTSAHDMRPPHQPADPRPNPSGPRWSSERDAAAGPAPRQPWSVAPPSRGDEGRARSTPEPPQPAAASFAGGMEGSEQTPSQLVSSLIKHMAKLEQAYGGAFCALLLKPVVQQAEALTAGLREQAGMPRDPRLSNAQAPARMRLCAVQLGLPAAVLGGASMAGGAR